MDLPSDPHYSPDAPLPGAPDPWAASSAPPRRPGPPYIMDEMVAAEPALAERLLWRVPGSGGAALAAEIRAAAAAGAPIVVTGCGTSEHGAMAIAAILTDALRGSGHPARVIAAQAFEAALDPQAGGLVIGISHEGATAATIRAMDAGRERGARVGLVTVSDRSPAAARADIVVTTGEQDQSWCHTVGYLSPVLVGAALAGLVGGLPPEAGVIRDLLWEGTTRVDAAETIAASLAGMDRLLVAGSGTDLIAARELALKVAEACSMPTTAFDIETVLHGHLAATGPTTGMIVLVTDPAHRNERWERAVGLMRAAGRIGMRSGAIVGAGMSWALPPELTPAGRILVQESPELAGPVASLVGTAGPLQLVASRLARARGVNPDAIRLDDPAHLEASRLAG
jgi:glucosamine--fructose-6-phosphate aminotransferase (isomerizing)